MRCLNGCDEEKNCGEDYQTGSGVMTKDFETITAAESADHKVAMATHALASLIADLHVMERDPVTRASVHDDRGLIEEEFKSLGRLVQKLRQRQLEAAE